MRITPQYIEAIRECLRRNQWTQQQLAARANVNPATISRILAGKRDHVTDLVSGRLAPFLSLVGPMDDLICVSVKQWRDCRATYKGRVDHSGPDGYKLVVPEFASDPGSLVLVRTRDGDYVEGRMWQCAVVVVEDADVRKACGH